MNALQLFLIQIDERVEPLQDHHHLGEENVPGMVMFDVADLMAQDVGVHIFVGKESITEERERTLFATGEYRRAAVHLMFRRTDDERYESPQLDEEQQCHHADT